MQQVPQSILSILDAYYQFEIKSRLTILSDRSVKIYRIVGIDTVIKMWTDVNNVCRCNIEQGQEYYGTGQGDTPESALQNALSALDNHINRTHENWTH